MMFTSKKNIDRNPRIAKILEKKTMYGSFVTAKIAGIESSAKIRSVNSTINKTKNRVVISIFPFFLTKNWFPAKSGSTEKYLEPNFTIK